MPPRNRYTWDEASGRYRNARTGRYVARSTVRRGLSRAVTTAERRIGTLARQLQAREVTLADWQTAMRVELRNVHGYAAASARGGLAQMSPADWGRVGQRLRFQYEKLGAFARQIEAGLPLDGRFVRRAMMYGSSSRETFERTQGLVLLARGFDEVRSIRHARDSCDGCVEQAKRGWQDPADYVYPGRRDCLTACLCTSQWRNRQTQKVAA